MSHFQSVCQHACQHWHILLKCVEIFMTVTNQFIFYDFFLFVCFFLRPEDTLCPVSSLAGELTLILEMFTNLPYSSLKVHKDVCQYVMFKFFCNWS